MALPVEFVKILGAFADCQVDFIVVGGVAAILNNVLYTTQDVDVVHRRTPENIERVLTVIQKLEAYYWPDLARRKLLPRPSDLAGHGHC